MNWKLDLFTKSPFALVLCMLLYMVQAAAFWRIGQRGLALAHLAYALANVGLVWAWYEVTS